jgi:5-methylcytosine-specific restriction endonuclease McrA
MTMLYACMICGQRSSTPRCDRHPLPRRARGRAFEATRLRIAARDRWICQICGGAIDPALRRPHPDALHIHHRAPRASGGGDSDDNLQAAHALCNLRA